MEMEEQNLNDRKEELTELEYQLTVREEAKKEKDDDAKVLDLCD